MNAELLDSVMIKAVMMIVLGTGFFRLVGMLFMKEDGFKGFFRLLKVSVYGYLIYYICSVNLIIKAEKISLLTLVVFTILCFDFVDSLCKFIEPIVKHFKIKAIEKINKEYKDRNNMI